MGNASSRATTAGYNTPYLSAGQLNYFRDRLLQWRRSLLDQQRELLGDLAQELPRPADPIDQGVEDAGRLQLLEQQQRTRRLLQQIAAALNRIEDGSYGYCLESGEEIGLRRLEALPTATLSVEMQEEIERRERFRRRNHPGQERMSS